LYDFTSVFYQIADAKATCLCAPLAYYILEFSLRSSNGDRINAMHTIEATPILLGVLSGFVTGVVTGLGIALARVTRTDLSMETLDKLLLGLSLLAAFALGVFISLVFR
jgi:hypothetical protein